MKEPTTRQRHLAHNIDITRNINIALQDIKQCSTRIESLKNPPQWLTKNLYSLSTRLEYILLIISMRQNEILKDDQ